MLSAVSSAWHFCAAALRIFEPHFACPLSDRLRPVFTTSTIAPDAESTNAPAVDAARNAPPHSMPASSPLSSAFVHAAASFCFAFAIEASRLSALPLFSNCDHAFRTAEQYLPASLCLLEAQISAASGLLFGGFDFLASAV